MSPEIIMRILLEPCIRILPATPIMTAVVLVVPVGFVGLDWAVVIDSMCMDLIPLLISAIRPPPTHPYPQPPIPTHRREFPQNRLLLHTASEPGICLCPGKRNRPT